MWLAYYWPPCRLGVTAAARSRGLTSGLHALGWDVTVVTKDRCDGCRFECGSTAEAPGLTVVSLPSRWRVARSAWSRLRDRVSEFPNTWTDEVRSWLEEHAAEHDVLVASISPYTVAGLAQVHRDRCAVVIDARDAVVPPMRWGRRRLLATLRRRPARRALPRVGLVVHVTPGEAARDRRLMGSTREVVVLSAGDEPLRPGPPPPREGRPLTIAFAGTFVDGVKTPEALFAALAAVRRQRNLTRDAVLLRFAGRQRTEVEKWADAAGVLDLVDAVGQLDAAGVEELYRGADVLLLVSGHAEGVPGSKLYEYLQWDRPVLAVGGDDPWLRDLLVSERAGVLVTDAPRLAAWLEAATEAHRSGEAPPGFVPDPARGARHRWPARAAQLDAALREVLR